jgi:hypothetical protein
MPRSLKGLPHAATNSRANFLGWGTLMGVAERKWPGAVAMDDECVRQRALHAGALNLFSKLEPFVGKAQPTIPQNGVFVFAAIFRHSLAEAR